MFRKKIQALVLISWGCLCPAFVHAQTTTTDNLSTQGNIETATQKPKKKSFLKAISKPFVWIGKNWNAYDPKYSTPSFYNWAGQLQNTFSQEWLNMHMKDGMQVNMRSALSSRIGPAFGYRWLFYGLSVDLGAMHSGKKSDRKNEFTLSINSNLFNIDIIRRRTGGDFFLRKMTTPVVDTEKRGTVQKDITDQANERHVGDLVKYDVTGVNINYFTNFKKYSNPAAFSNGAIQLRSVGSPIIGFGIIRQKLQNSVCDLMESTIFNNVFQQLQAKDQGVSAKAFVDDFNSTFKTNITDAQSLTTLLDETYDADNIKLYKSMVGHMINNESIKPMIFGEYDADGNLKSTGMLNSIINEIPSTVTIDDWHLNLGYSYNLVFSRRLLLGLTAIASPGFKHLRMDNKLNMTNICAEEFANVIGTYYQADGVDPDYFRMNVNMTNFGVDYSARASLTYNFNRWRAGVNAMANAYIYKNEGTSMYNIYGSANVYVGYCFGRKKQYRWNGKDRQVYIQAALTPKQKEEMRDTLPSSNIDNHDLAIGGKSTKYHTDHIDFDIAGCDLVKGPDGNYGYYIVEDGYVTPGQDSEGHLQKGTIFHIDEDGSFKISLGHDPSIRCANWWKSQLSLRQIPTNWYPEMLHYAMRGTLTLWVRNFRLGSVSPVKLVIPDFCIAHGIDTKPFVQIASKQFNSHSAYSIIGDVSINGRRTRIYIESKHNGKYNYINVEPMKASNLNWMAKVDDASRISRVSIPGTHDAGTASLPENQLTSMAHTQNLTIAEQLEDGIRAFDIRLKENMKFGHTFECRDGFPETLEFMEKFLKEHPSEFVIAMIGSDESGKWSETMKANFNTLLEKYKDLFVQDFSSKTTVGEARGKILVIKRQEECPFGKLLTFQDNAIFQDKEFCVEDVYKEHKTYRKIKLVEKHIREAHENLDPNKWYITFNSIAYAGPKHHKPYYYAWGAVNVRKPMNPSLREIIELKNYTNIGIVFLDFYNDHCDRPQLVDAIIQSNFTMEIEKDFIPMP